MGFQNQPQDGYTCPDSLNTRNEDVFESRLRGGSRPGLAQILPPKASDETPTVVTTVTSFFTTKDTWIDDVTTTATHNNDNLYIGVGRNVAGRATRTILHFDLDSIPTTPTPTITIATLQMTAAFVAGGGVGAKVKRITQGSSWVDTQATWINYVTATAWSPVNYDGTVPPATGPYTDTDAVSWTTPTAVGDFSITGLATLVQDAVTNRSGDLFIMLMYDDEVTDAHYVVARSSEYRIAHPELNILLTLAVTYTTVI
jgi:hypothetical protein